MTIITTTKKFFKSKVRFLLYNFYLLNRNYIKRGKDYEKHLLLSIVTTITLGINAYANMDEIEGLTVTKVDCDNGLKGYTLEIKKDGVENSVHYQSCSDATLVVKDPEGNIVSGGPVSVETGKFVANANPESVVVTSGTRHSQAITRNYTFANGYTEPTVEADNTCAGGYQDQMAWGRTSCSFSEGSGYLDDNGGLNEGWLNLSTLSDYHTISGLGLKNIDNLKNLQMVNNGSLDIVGTSITNLDGLINLEGHSSQNSGSFTGTEWGTDRLVTNAAFTSRGVNFSNNSLLENVNGLINLKATAYLNLKDNPSLTDISGLANVTTRPGMQGLYLDNKEYEVKMPADSWLCQNVHEIRAYSPDGSYVPATYSNVCE